MKRLSALLILASLVAAPAFASDASIIQKDQAFEQSNVTISAGDTVRWGNVDDFDHNISIHSPSGKDADLGMQAHGVIIAHKFEERGVYRIFCKIHPRMKMTVTVK